MDGPRRGLDSFSKTQLLPLQATVVRVLQGRIRRKEMCDSGRKIEGRELGNVGIHRDELERLTLSTPVTIF